MRAWPSIFLMAILSSVSCQGASGAGRGGSLPSGASNGNASFSEVPTQKVISTLTSEQIYGALTMGKKDSDPAANLEERIGRIGKIEFSQFISAVEKSVTNDALTFDGIMSIAGAKTKFLAALPKIKQLAFKWGNFENYWRAQGLNPKTLMTFEVQKAVSRSAKYFNVPEKQASPMIEQANLQDEIDRINAERAKGTVSKSANVNCDRYGQPRCTPDPIVMESVKLQDISFEACKLPSGLDLKHLCTQAAAIGGGIMLSDKRLEAVGAVIAAASLICAAESTAPVAFACMPGNTFSSDPSF